MLALERRAMCAKFLFLLLLLAPMAALAQTCPGTDNAAFAITGTNLQVATLPSGGITDTNPKVLCIKASAPGLADFYQPVTVTGSSSGGACTNTSTTLCFIVGSFGPDSGAPTWMGRPWDFTAAAIGQNQCNAISTGFPFEGGADNPGVIGDYHTLVDANNACPVRIYAYKTQNEWWFNCNQTNPWQVPPLVQNGNCNGSSPS